MSFTIVTDTSANLSTAYLKANGVAVIPFKYSMGGEERRCLDTELFDREEADAYYAAIKSGERVFTSQITPGEFAEAFEPILAAGQDLLFVSMSSGISGSYDSSAAAAEELRAKYPARRIIAFDTLAASLGEGLFVMHAIACRAAGKSIEETAEFLSERRERLCQIVLVEDLMHLHRGGRISAPKALLGTVLGIRPILKGDEAGHLVVRDKVRGRKKGLSLLADRYGELVNREIGQTVCIAYTDCREDALLLGEMIRAAYEPKELIIERYEPVTGAHIGPGTVALFFEGPKGVRSM